MTLSDLSDRPVLDPIPDAPLPEFPRNEELPEGCQLLEGLSDNDAYQVEYREATYVTRTLADGNACPRTIYVLVPSTKDPLVAAHNAGGYPCVLFVQGSAWHKQNIYQHFSDLVHLCEHGFVVAAVQYRESDLAPFPAQMIDAKAALRFLREHAAEYHIDTDRMAVWGDSSGGHTALMAAYTAGILSREEVPATQEEPFESLRVVVEGEAVELDDPNPQQSAEVRCVVDWYGPTLLDQMSRVPSAMDHTDPASPEGMVLGRCSPLTHPEWVAVASPLRYVPPASVRRLPPTLIMHGGRDQLVNFEQSVLLYQKLREADQDVTFYKLPDANHGSNGFRCAGALDVVETFLRKHLA